MPVRRKGPVRRKRRPSNWRAKYNPRPFQLTKRRPGPLAPRIINFKRSAEKTLILNNSAAPEDWTALPDNSLVRNYVVGLSEINDKTDFTALFQSYRIKGIRLQGYFSNTSSESNENLQVMMHYCQNNMGDTQASELTEQWFLDKPRSRRKLLLSNTGRPCFDIYMPVSQLSQVYNTALNTDYGMIRPRFISTNETTTPHYAFSVSLKRVDGQVFSLNTLNYPTLKIIETVYFQMRGIH